MPLKSKILKPGDPQLRKHDLDSSEPTDDRPIEKRYPFPGRRSPHGMNWDRLYTCRVGSAHGEKRKRHPVKTLSSAEIAPIAVDLRKRNVID